MTWDYRITPKKYKNFSREDIMNDLIVLQNEWDTATPERKKIIDRDTEIIMDLSDITEKEFYDYCVNN